MRAVTDFFKFCNDYYAQKGYRSDLLYVGYRIAEDMTGGTRQLLRAFAPWAALILLLFVVSVWIVYQPMQMRGTLEMAG